MNFRHSKIVCTIGPASRSPKMIDRLLDAGMDVARLNFSHGTHEEHAKNISTLRAASGKHQKPIAILTDLQGPKIRTGPLAGGGPVLLRTGNAVGYRSTLQLTNPDLLACWAIRRA